MITKAIQKALAVKATRGWEKMYWAFDIHETILKPNWTAGVISHEFYPLAKEALLEIEQRQDIVKILYTCSHPHEIEQYLEYFASFGIHFDYVNENPEVLNGGYGCYDKKPYFNVLFEDKAGFDATTDWLSVLDFLKEPQNVREV
ncbi:MAG: hypothetical protein AAGA85_21125 [Bacteroidota bacterium]